MEWFWCENPEEEEEIGLDEHAHEVRSHTVPMLHRNTCTPPKRLTYLSSEAMDVSKNISDLTQAMLGESSHPFLTLKKTNIIRNPWLAMLLLAGDVQSNPGPGRSYPCTVCQRNVRNHDASVSCDQCNGWSHTVCVGISEAEYDTLMEQGSFDFFCHKCTLAELPSYPSSPERELNDTDPTIDTDNFRNTGNALRIVNINVNSIKSTYKIVLFHELRNLSTGI